MIKRDRRNIGKIVVLSYPIFTLFNGRKGKVVGFRGDFDKGDPYVNVFVYDKHSTRRGSVWPVPGSFLVWTGERKGGLNYVSGESE